MKFCPECSRIINPNGKCGCGYEDPSKEPAILSEKIDSVKKIEVEVVEDDSDKYRIEMKHVCKKCGYNKAEVKDLGVMVADESPVTLFTCLKCNFTERQSDGSGSL